MATKQSKSHTREKIRRNAAKAQSVAGSKAGVAKAAKSAGRAR